MAAIILEAADLEKSFIQPDKNKLAILQNLCLQVEQGSLVAVTGASGSGKSTLLHLLGSLDLPDKGAVYFAGEDIATFNRKRLAAYRNRDIGFVFQFHYLMPELTVLENVAAPALIQSFNRDSAFAIAGDLLREVGLAEKLAVMPYQLSGGEKQRAAIARSLINSPRLLLADEPIGSLDWKTGETVFQVFKQLIHERGLT
ncbi:MAG: ATP-binding cassette domain-containing protein, partial [Chrysiogenales bacterium]